MGQKLVSVSVPLVFSEMVSLIFLFYFGSPFWTWFLISYFFIRIPISEIRDLRGNCYLVLSKLVVGNFRQMTSGPLWPLLNSFLLFDFELPKILFGTTFPCTSRISSWIFWGIIGSLSDFMGLSLCHKAREKPLVCLAGISLDNS